MFKKRLVQKKRPKHHFSKVSFTNAANTLLSLSLLKSTKYHIEKAYTSKSEYSALFKLIRQTLRYIKVI